MKKKIKEAKEAFDKDKLKYFLVAGLLLFVLKDCAGSILDWTKDRTMEYMNTPETVQELKEKVKRLDKRLLFVEKNYKRK